MRITLTAFFRSLVLGESDPTVPGWGWRSTFSESSLLSCVPFHAAPPPPAAPATLLMYLSLGGATVPY